MSDLSITVLDSVSELSEICLIQQNYILSLSDSSSFRASYNYYMGNLLNSAIRAALGNNLRMDNSQNQSNAPQNQNASGAEAPPPSDGPSEAVARLLATMDSLVRHIDNISGVRRRPDMAPVAVIDLANSDPPATNRAPDAVIDLCSPDRPQAVGPTVLGRRRHSPDSTSDASTATDDGPPAPKRACPDCAMKEDFVKCPVCLDRARTREPVAAKCGHVFCKACLVGAIRSTHKCPLCNKKLTMRQFSRIYF